MNADWRDRLAIWLQAQAAPPHKFGHQPRLFALAQTLADATPETHFDLDVVFAAAFLHDLGVFVGHRPQDPASLPQWDHVAYVCERAPALLQSFGFPASKIPLVLEVMQQHQPADNPTSPEAVLLRDADILEQLGAIGILRTASKLGSDTRFHRFADVATSLRRTRQSLPLQLRMPAAQWLALPRLAALEAFLHALDAEAGEHLG